MLKRALSSFLIAIATFSGPVLAQVATFKFSGVVTSYNGSGLFVVGKPYTLDIFKGMDDAPISYESEDSRAFPGVVLNFNYDSGVYEARGGGGVLYIENDPETGDLFQVSDPGKAFPFREIWADDLTYYYDGFELSIKDPTGTMLKSVAVPDRFLSSATLSSLKVYYSGGLVLELSIDKISPLPALPPKPTFRRQIISENIGDLGNLVNVADFNGDGRLDLAIMQGEYVTNTLLIRIGRADGSFERRNTIALDSFGDSAVADFNKDGRDDLAVVCGTEDGRVMIITGQSDGTATVLSSISIHRYPKEVRTGDFNRDGNADILHVNGTSFVTLHAGHGDGTFDPARYFEIGPYVTTLVVADFNRDGFQDFAAGQDEDDARLFVVLGQGDGDFDPPQPYSLGRSEVGALASGDFDGDGNPDLAATLSRDRLALLRGKGDGTFGPPGYLVTTELSSGLLSMTDLNADLLADIVYCSSEHTAIIPGNPDSELVPVIALEGPVRMADFNADGRTDLADSNSGFALINESRPNFRLSKGPAGYWMEWPLGGNYRLEYRASFTPGSGWLAYPGPPSLLNDRYSVLLREEGQPAGFFRLRMQ